MLPQPFLPQKLSNKAKGRMALSSCVGKVEPVEGALALGMDVCGRWILRLQGLVYRV